VLKVVNFNELPSDKFLISDAFRLLNMIVSRDGRSAEGRLIELVPQGGLGAKLCAPMLMEGQ